MFEKSYPQSANKSYLKKPFHTFTVWEGFFMEKKKTWPVGTGGRIGWLKAFLVSYLISLLLLLLLSFFLWKFSCRGVAFDFLTYCSSYAISISSL